MLTSLEAGQVFQSVYCDRVDRTCPECGEDILYCNCSFRKDSVDDIMKYCDDADQTIQLASDWKRAQLTLEIAEERLRSALGFKP
jgi:hypothetical protein